MDGIELINILNENGAIKDFYKVMPGPNMMIDGKWWNSVTLLITVEDFIKKFINNLNIENDLYVYDIMDNPVTHTHTLNSNDPNKYIRFFEHDTICEYKIRIKKLSKIKDIINGD